MTDETKIDGRTRPRTQKFLNARKRGEDHPRSKVTADQVREMRRLWTEERLTLKEIQERLNLSIEPKSIHGIVKRHTWKHVV